MWLWDKYFSKEEIQQINDLIDKEYISEEDESLKGNGKNVSNVKNIPYGRIKNLISSIVEDAFHTTNYRFGYQTFNPHRDSYLILNTYTSDNKDNYDWHIDISESDIYDLKCTLIINASTDDYVGGEFEVFQGFKERIEILDNVGSVLLLKSPMNHRVLPVTKGTRKSLIMFIYGNKWQ